MGEIILNVLHVVINSNTDQNSLAGLEMEDIVTERSISISMHVVVVTVDNVVSDFFQERVRVEPNNLVLDSYMHSYSVVSERFYPD